MPTNPANSPGAVLREIGLILGAAAFLVLAVFWFVPAPGAATLMKSLSARPVFPLEALCRRAYILPSVKETAMLDIAFIVIGLGFLRESAMLVYAVACDRL